jgi:PadR family transcriptional regulator PadR
MGRDLLGAFEHHVLLAILRLGDAAYAPAILDEIERATGRPPAAGSVYVTLDRLEAKALIRSRLGDDTPDRGGRPRRYVALTARGLREVRTARSELSALWRGLEGLLDAT